MSVENGNGNGQDNPAEKSKAPLWESKVEVLEENINTQKVLLPDGQEVFRLTPLLRRKELERQTAETMETPTLAWEGSV